LDSHLKIAESEPRAQTPEHPDEIVATMKLVYLLRLGISESRVRALPVPEHARATA